MSDKPIGISEVDLSKLADHTVHDVWLPVVGAKTSAESQVHVLARYTPLNIAGLKIKSSRLPSFRMQLERRTYFPGELIRGHVIYNVGEPKKIRGVRVKFQGHEHVSWTETRTVRRPDGTVGTELVHFAAHHTFFNPIATLYGNQRGENKDFKIQSSTYVWPFEFCLPLNLPPTYNHHLGSIKYAIEAYVDIPWAADKIVKMPIDVIVSYTSLKLFQPTLKVSKKTKGNFFFSDGGQIVLVAQTQDVAYAGENQAIGVNVTNHTTKFIKELHCELKYKQKFIAFHLGHCKQRKDSRKILKVTVPCGIAPGAQWAGVINLTIPADSPVSVLKQLSPFISTKYELEIEAVTEGSGKLHSGVEFELIVGVRHPAEWTPPTQAMGAPNVIHVLKTDNIAQQQMNMIMAPPPIQQEIGASDWGLVGAVLPPTAYQQNLYTPETYADPKDPATQAYVKPQDTELVH